MITRIQSQPAQNNFGTKVECENIFSEYVLKKLKNDGKDYRSLFLKTENNLDTLILKTPEKEIPIITTTKGLTAEIWHDRILNMPEYLDKIEKGFFENMDELINKTNKQEPSKPEKKPRKKHIK